MKNILEDLENVLKTMPNKAFFRDTEQSLSVSDVCSRAKKIGSTLAKLNVKNQPFAVFDNRDVDTLCAMLGVVYSGNYYVVIDTYSPVDRLAKIYDVLKPVLSIGKENNLELAKELNVADKTKLVYDLYNEKIDEILLSKVRARMISTDPIYVLFTSGSTGIPKGAILSHEMVISYTDWFIKEFNISSETVFGSQLSFYFSASVSDIFSTVRTGAEFNIIPKSYFSFPIKLVEFLEERKVNTIYWVPSALCIVANLKLFDYKKPTHLKQVLFAGEVMPNKQLNYWRKHLEADGTTFANLFGPTETVDICTFYRVNRQFRDDEPLPIGVHIDNCDTFVVGGGAKEIKEPGEIGELYVRGALVAFGYFDNKDKTSEAFVQNPLQNHYPEIVYKTGDLVKINEYGEYDYAGRKDFQIKHMGYRIELGEIENSANALDKVTGVVCVYDAEKDLIVALYTGALKKDDFIAQIKTKVPAYMVPNVVIKLPAMPYNQNGKVDRKYLKNNYKSLIKE